MKNRSIHLIRSKEKNKKNISIRIDSDSNDEIEKLTNDIRKMVNRINHLSDKKYSYEILSVKL